MESPRSLSEIDAFAVELARVPATALRQIAKLLQAVADSIESLESHSRAVRNENRRVTSQYHSLLRELRETEERAEELAKRRRKRATKRKTTTKRKRR